MQTILAAIFVVVAIGLFVAVSIFKILDGPMARAGNIASILSIVLALVLLAFPNLVQTTPPKAPCQPGDILCEIYPDAEDGQVFDFHFPPGSISYQYSQGCSHSGSYGLQLTTDGFTQDGSGGWGVGWYDSPTRHLDASRYTALTFWVKGLVGGETFHIGFKDTSGTQALVESKSLVTVSQAWTKATTPLSGFKGNGVNMASISTMHFGFTRNHSAGSICIDEIAFSQ